MKRPERTPPIPFSGLGALAAHESDSDPHPTYQQESARGQPEGYAELDADGLVPVDQLPAFDGVASSGVVSGPSTASDAYLRDDGSWSHPADDDWRLVTLAMYLP